MALHNGNTPDETDLPAVRLEVGFTSEGWPRWVTLTEHGPISQHVTKLAPDHAEAIGETMIRAAKMARQGIVLPGEMPGPT